MTADLADGRASGLPPPGDDEPTRSERKNFPLRIDPLLFAALRQWANDELRSVNAQIEFLLAAAVRDAGRAVRRPASRPRPDPTE